ncbi:hypothetical protein E7T06_05035 [Deinococcus sp. Arct2-2]|nr:hypothetical protein E7T06_05035 [Deinococcus sp. Arct2-2]
MTSTEGKAIMTGQAIAHHLGLPLKTPPGLQEHGWLTVDTTSRLEDFQAGMQHLFAHPHLHVFGDESAEAARIRFTTALEALMTDQMRFSTLRRV